MAARKSRPTPLRNVQNAVQADQSRRYLILVGAHSSLPSPAYPFERQAAPSAPLCLRLQEEPSTWQIRTPAPSDSPCVGSRLLDSLSTPPLARVEPGVELLSGAPDYRWNDSPDSQDDGRLGPVPSHSLRPRRSLTPPISPPVSSPPARDSEYWSKRSGMTFALVPAEVDGMHVFTHVVVDDRGNDFMASSPSIPSSEDGLPEDMQDILRQLDDLAGWVREASSSRDHTSNIKSRMHATCLAGRSGTGPSGNSTCHLTSEPFPNKGKNRLLSPNLPNSECGTLVESSGGAMLGIPTNIFPDTDRPSEGFIYVPNCNTPEFLAGSSNSPVAYPVCGYSSHPARHPPHPPAPMHDIPYHRRFLERRSAPCPPPTLSLASPLGKTSFKTLFQRSRCNTTAVSRPSISSGHVPVEGALRQGKRMRLPWLKI